MAHMRSSLMCMTPLMYRWLAADIEDVMFTIRGVANKLGGFTGVAVKSVHSEELWPCCFSVDRDPKDRPGSRLQRGEADSPTCAHLHLDADIPTHGLGGERRMKDVELHPSQFTVRETMQALQPATRSQGGAMPSHCPRLTWIT